MPAVDTGRKNEPRYPSVVIIIDPSSDTGHFCVMVSRVSRCIVVVPALRYTLSAQPINRRLSAPSDALPRASPMQTSLRLRPSSSIQGSGIRVSFDRRRTTSSRASHKLTSRTFLSGYPDGKLETSSAKLKVVFENAHHQEPSNTEYSLPHTIQTTSVW